MKARFTEMRLPPGPSVPLRVLVLLPVASLGTQYYSDFQSTCEKQVTIVRTITRKIITLPILPSGMSPVLMPIGATDQQVNRFSVCSTSS